MRLNLRYDFNALCQFEQATGFSALDPKLPATLATNVSALRGMVWAGSLHANPKLTLKQVGESFALTEVEQMLKSVFSALDETFGIDPDAEIGDPA